MSELTEVFEQLRNILEPFAAGLDRKIDTEAELYVDTWHVMKNGKPLFFGAVQVRKSYVSFHLMPVYVRPSLLDGVSPALKKRMQGKSCFNFSKINPALFSELVALTEAGFASYREQGFVQ